MHAFTVEEVLTQNRAEAGYGDMDKDFSRIVTDLKQAEQGPPVQESITVSTQKPPAGVAQKVPSSLVSGAVPPQPTVTAPSPQTGQPPAIAGAVSTPEVTAVMEQSVGGKINPLVAAIRSALGKTLVIAGNIESVTLGRLANQHDANKQIAYLVANGTLSEAAADEYSKMYADVKAIQGANLGNTALGAELYGKWLFDHPLSDADAKALNPTSVEMLQIAPLAALKPATQLAVQHVDDTSPQHGLPGGNSGGRKIG